MNTVAEPRWGEKKDTVLLNYPDEKNYTDNVKVTPGTRHCEIQFDLLPRHAIRTGSLRDYFIKIPFVLQMRKHI